MTEVREARYFIAVAEELNFGRAAERLHMSQPPLSQAIRAIERRLGVKLLHRTTREVRLTTAGDAFLERCRQLVGASLAADRAAQAAASGLVGELRVGAVTSAVMHPLPRALEQFRALHPGVHVRVEEIDSHAAVQAVKRRELDVALVRLLSTPADCERRPLLRESFVLAVPEGWPLADRKRLDLAAASDLPWIWLPRTISPDYHDQVVACCRAAGFAPAAQHAARSISSQLALVSAGLGVALVPGDSAASHLPAGVRLVRLRSSVQTELAALWRIDASPLVEALIDGALAR